MTDSHKIKGVLINLGEETCKTIFRSNRISVLGIPTGPTKGYRPKLLWPRHTTHKVSFVEVASVAGAWKYLGSRKTRRARGLSGTRSLSPRVSPSRVPFFLAPTTSKRLLRRLCWGSSFFQRDIISALSLGRATYLSTILSVRSHRLPSNLRNLDLFSNHLPQIARRIPLAGDGAQG